MYTPIGRLLAGASESDIKSNELEMSNMQTTGFLKVRFMASSFCMSPAE